VEKKKFRDLDKLDNETFKRFKNLEVSHCNNVRGDERINKL